MPPSADYVCSQSDMLTFMYCITKFITKVIILEYYVWTFNEYGTNLITTLNPNWFNTYKEINSLLKVQKFHLLICASMSYQMTFSGWILDSVSNDDAPGDCISRTIHLLGFEIRRIDWKIRYRSLLNIGNHLFSLEHCNTRILIMDISGIAFSDFRFTETGWTGLLVMILGYLWTYKFKFFLFCFVFLLNSFAFSPITNHTAAQILGAKQWSCVEALFLLFLISSFISSSFPSIFCHWSLWQPLQL